MNRSDKPALEHAARAFLAGGGEMAERIRTLDWSKTPLGPVFGGEDERKLLPQRLPRRVAQDALGLDVQLVTRPSGSKGNFSITLGWRPASSLDSHSNFST